MRRNSFSGPEISTGRQTSSFDQDTSGHLAAVLSSVNASDFPKLDFESEQSRAGAAESWMQLMGLKMSAVSTEVADYWECTEHEVRGKYKNVFAYISDGKGTFSSKCITGTEVPAL